MRLASPQRNPPLGGAGRPALAGPSEARPCPRPASSLGAVGRAPVLLAASPTHARQQGEQAHDGEDTLGKLPHVVPPTATLRLQLQP